MLIELNITRAYLPVFDYLTDALAWLLFYHNTLFYRDYQMTLRNRGNLIYPLAPGSVSGC